MIICHLENKDKSKRFSGYKILRWKKTRFNVFISQKKPAAFHLPTGSFQLRIKRDKFVIE